MTQCPEGWWHLADYKVTSHDHLGKKLLPKIHCSSHRMIHRTQDLLRRSDVKVRDRQQEIADIVSHRRLVN